MPPPASWPTEARKRSRTEAGDITVTPAEGGGSTIRYEAEVRLHGPARLLWDAAPIALILVGNRALSGMRKRLDERAGTS